MNRRLIVGAGALVVAVAGGVLWFGPLNNDDAGPKADLKQQVEKQSRQQQDAQDRLRELTAGD